MGYKSVAPNRRSNTVEVDVVRFVSSRRASHDKGVLWGMYMGRAGPEDSERGGRCEGAVVWGRLNEEGVDELECDNLERRVVMILYIQERR